MNDLMVYNNEMERGLDLPPFLINNSIFRGDKVMTKELISQLDIKCQEPLLCACGCGQVVKPGNKFINHHNRKGLKSTVGHKQKISAALIGKPKSKEHCKNIRKGQIGKKVSEETKQKLSISHMGQSAWNKGIPMTEEGKQHLRIVNTGKKISEETRVKISKAHMGRVVSDETKTKISKAHIGKILSNETKIKLVLANIKADAKIGEYCGAWYDKEYKTNLRKSTCEGCGITNMMNIHLFGYKLSLHHTKGKVECAPKYIMTLCHSCHAIADWKLRRNKEDMIS